MNIFFDYTGNDNENYDLNLHVAGKNPRKIAKLFVSEDMAYSISATLNSAFMIADGAQGLIAFKQDMLDM